MRIHRRLAGILVVVVLAPLAHAQELDPRILEILTAFMAEEEFVEVENLDELPPEITNTIPRWRDGSFAIAESDERWNDTDAGRPGIKNSRHMFSLLSRKLGVIVYARGGFGVMTRVIIVDRGSGESIACFVGDRDSNSNLGAVRQSLQARLQRPDWPPECGYVPVV